MENDLISRSALLDKLQPLKERLIFVFESLENGIEKRLCSAEACGILDAINQVNIAPTVDAVEVVRCGECVCMRITETGRRYCGAWGRIQTMGDDGYCCFGERRVDDGK